MGERRKNKKKKIIPVIFLLIIAICIGGYFAYYNSIKAVDASDKEEIAVTIPSGSSAYAIVSILDKNGLIRNRIATKVFLKLNAYDHLQANTYILNKSMDLKTIFEIINQGDFKFVAKEKITIIDGATIPETAKVISKATGINEQKILRKWSNKVYLNKLIKKYWFLTDEIANKGILFPLEGYFYPETYFITGENPDIEQVTEVLLDSMDKVLAPFKETFEQRGMSAHQFLSLASVIQGESLFEKDKPIIAGVFINRLEKEMPLQSDITVLYALQEKRVNVTFKDLAVESPYNTYKHAGLPIGPVCNVSQSTLEALKNYDQNDYLYFFATKDGKVIYSKTLAEHEKATKDNLWY